MKRTSKAVLSFVLMLVLVMCAATTAFAAGSVTYKGASDGFEFKPGSEYTDTDLFDNFKNAMPGDTLTGTVTFTNTATDNDKVDLYLRAYPHDDSENPLSEKVAETETPATAEEFLAQLSMKVWNGDDLIFDATADQLGGLQEDVLIGTFNSGESATLKIELKVPVELGNEFADRTGEVDWIFKVNAYDEEPLPGRKEFGSLTITNSVKGSAADKDKYFDFTVTFDDDGTYTYTGSKSGTIKSGDTIALKDGESITISGIPEGTKYTVTESDNDGYTVTKSGDTGTIAKNAEAKASFVNTKEGKSNPIIPKTGDSSKTVLWISLMAVCLIVLAAVGMKRRKTEK